MPGAGWKQYGNGAAKLWPGDCRAILASIAADPLRVLMLADPPYGCGLENHDPGGARGDRSFHVAGDESQALGSEICSWAERLGLPAVVFADIQLPWPGKWRQSLVWDKGPAVGGGGDTGKLWKQTVEIIQVARTGKLNGKRDEACLHFHITPSDSQNHPCEKPTKLLRYLIEKTTQPGDIIFDPFMGSGSAGVAAIQCGRQYIGAESDPEHFKTAERRIRREFDRPLLRD